MRARHARSIRAGITRARCEAADARMHGHDLTPHWWYLVPAGQPDLEERAYRRTFLRIQSRRPAPWRPTKRP